MRKRRHWLRGIIGGILLGLGTRAGIDPPRLYPWVMVLIGLVLGILLIFVPAPWGGRPPPPERRAGTTRKPSEG